MATKTGEYKAFQGANGWYVAYERADGFHRQPQSGNMTESEARRRAAAANREKNETAAVE